MPKRSRAVVPAPKERRDDFSRDVAGAWSALSPFKRETGIAVERWRIMVTIRGLDPVLTFYAIATLAAQSHDRWHPHAPYHAVAFTEVVARTYIARIREVLREIEKSDQDEYGRVPRRNSVLRPIGAVVGQVVREIHGRRT